MILLADLKIILECNIIVDFNDRNLGNQPYFKKFSYYHTKPSSPTQGIWKTHQWKLKTDSINNNRKDPWVYDIVCEMFLLFFK